MFIYDYFNCAREEFEELVKYRCQFLSFRFMPRFRYWCSANKLDGTFEFRIDEPGQLMGGVFMCDIDSLEVRAFYNINEYGQFECDFAGANSFWNDVATLLLLAIGNPSHYRPIQHVNKNIRFFSLPSDVLLEFGYNNGLVGPLFFNGKMINRCNAQICGTGFGGILYDLNGNSVLLQ